LTDAGVREAERLAGVESFYTLGNMEWPHLIDNALRATHMYQKDRHYMIAPDQRENNELSIIIIDEFTGRAMFGRQWSDGLHQAVEAKHQRDGVKIKQETQTLATVTLQNFFKLYSKVGGMTGTAMTEATEFWKIYKLEVVAIPTNKPLKRVNAPDLVYKTEHEKWEAVVNEVVEVNKSGRPILIGTTDVAKSEILSGYLKRKARIAECQAGKRRPRSGDCGPGRPRQCGHDQYEHGRPGNGHHPRRQPGNTRLGPAQTGQGRRRSADVSDPA
jgi:preprotein translocase subunit SecA